MGIPYEGNGYASLTFLTWITSSEIVLLVFSVGVLGIAFLMFVRLFDALSPPTKALTWVVGGNLVLALVLLAFACFQMHYYALREFIPQGGAFCHYVNPVVLSLVVFNWLGQPVIAWTTLKTLRNEPVPDQKLRHIYYACVGVSFVTYIWGVVLSPGVIVNGSFCVMIPKSPDYFEARGFGNLIGLATFFTSLVLYVKSYRHLGRLKRKLLKDMKRIRHADTAMEEAKVPAELSSLGLGSSHMSHSGGGPLEWTGEASRGASASVGDVESGQSGAGLGRGGSTGGPNDDWEDDELDSFDDSLDDSEDDAPFTYEQLQARTQAARAAVNILLPNCTDEMAEREGPYGMRRRFRGQGQRLLEEGVDLSALMEPKLRLTYAQSIPSGGSRQVEGQAQPGANEPSAPWRRVWRRCRRWQKQQRPQDPNAEVLQLYTKATRAVVGRAFTLLVVYYLPTYLLYGCLGAYKDFRPPADLLPIFGFIFFLGTPVLQTFALLHLAVTIGNNILQFYWQYSGDTGADGECARAGIAGTEEEAVGAAVEGAALVVETTPGTSGDKSDGFLYERGPAGPAPAGAASGDGRTGAGEQEGGATVPVPAGESEPHNGTLTPPIITPMPGAQPLGARPPPLRPVRGPLGVPQPSAFKRYAGRGQKAAPPRPASRQGHMQALSTIYEVAFKNRGRDAAAVFRHGISASTAAGAAGGGAAPEKAEQECGAGERKSTASDGSEGSGEAPTLQQNALVQEMLGVKVRTSGASSSSASGGSSTSSYAEDSAASSLSDDLSSGRSGSAEGESKGWAAVTGSFFPWHAGARSRSLSLADQSEISSLTDAHDYQIGSLGTSPAMTPWGEKALTPARPTRRTAALADPHSSSEEGGTSSDNPSSSSSGGGGSHSGSSIDSWLEKGARGDGAGASGSVSLAGMTHVSGSSGGSETSTNSSLLSDGGRSLVTESDWRDWVQNKKDGLVVVVVDGQQQQPAGSDQQQAPVTTPN